jgi:prevent-host-death family protein
MRTFGAFEAKNRLGALLDLVEQGEEVLITRHGKPAARLVAAAGEPDRKAIAREAVRRIRERRKGVTLGGISIRELIDEGRR